MIGITKVVEKTLASAIIKAIGEPAMKTFKNPIIEKKLKRDIARTAEHAEKRWIAEYNDDRDLVDAVRQMSLHDLPSIQETLRRLYDHPDDPITIQDFHGKLEENLPKGFNADRIEKAIASYMEILRSELINIEGLREKLNTIANIKTADNTAQIKELIAQLLPKGPEVSTLYDKLIKEKDTDPEKEFARIVDLLLFHETRREGKKIDFPVISDYKGIDNFDVGSYRRSGTTLFHCKFCPSPFSRKHRQDIVKLLKQIIEHQKESRHKKFILVTPQDLSESDEVAWFEGLRKKLGLKFELEHWGHTKLISLFKQTSALCLFYYPELTDDGVSRRKTVQDITHRYIDNLQILYRNIEFVGMSVYKPEATKGVQMEHIYIPVTVIPSIVDDEKDPNLTRTNPLEFTVQGARHIILGDPGSGKSTLLRFLAMSGVSEPIQKRYSSKPDKRLPILVILRRYADELKSNKNLSVIDYIQENIQADFSLESADINFFEYYLETGQAVLLFDGLDEVPTHLKEIVRNRIRSLVTTYPGNTTIVTSRIVGYENPFRFDENEFGHYRIAKLQLKEIEQFVNDWYAVRIENKREQELNVKDLVRIFQSSDHAAIRELGENPLLLTIIALVHRIDAVLPDERVVLYQKCTETLLNTWHTWKFRETEVKSRGKTERRNRRRMEAIANWMHQLIDIADSTKRAVVSYTDLKRFLTDHIADIEKLRDPDNDPEDFAEDFLKFVKERAGLLIEVGDKQYSFVHLTFQEYLTSSHIITNSETGGVKSIWEVIGEHCNDSKWHEVIRLLIGGLKSHEAQEWLIEKILSERVNSENVNKSLLLGGLLLDDIESAENRHREILRLLLQSGSMTKDIEQLRRISSMLRTWLMKSDENEEATCTVFKSLWEPADDRQKKSLMLVACTLNWSELKILGITGGDVVVHRKDADLFKLFFSDALLENIDTLKPDIELFWAAKAFLSLESSYGNFVAATGQALNASMKPHVHARRAFEEQLAVLLGLLNGPFHDFFMNSLQIVLYDQSFFNRQSDGKLKILLDLERALARDLERALARNLALARYLDRALDRALDRDLERALALARDRARDLPLAQARDLDLYLARTRTRTLERALARDMGLERARDKLWQTVLVKPELYSYILDLLCDIFALEPRSQWWEALRVAFLPKVPERIAPLFDQEKWKQVENAFTEGKADKTEIYSAAWQLLFDTWIYIHGGYDSPEESIFARIAELTRNLDNPPLRIAHCIRDLAYGDESRTDDLVAMVKSDDPEYRSIFEKCLWVPTPEEEIREAEKAQELSATQ